MTDPAGDVILTEAFDPKWVLRPYVDRFRDYEQVRVTTGWIEARAGDRTLADERIVTDPEAFWDYYQGTTLPAIYDYVMDRHEGIPRGGNADAPFFGELVVEAQFSEPDYRLDIDNEIHSTMDALHEEVYFGTIEFFDLIGRNSRGQGLTFPGRIIPVMLPKSDGAAGTANISFSGIRHLTAGGSRPLSRELRRDRRDAPGHPAHHHGTPIGPARARARRHPRPLPPRAACARRHRRRHARQPARLRSAPASRRAHALGRAGGSGHRPHRGHARPRHVRVRAGVPRPGIAGGAGRMDA